MYEVHTTNRRGLRGGGGGSACVMEARDSKSIMLLLKDEMPCPCMSCNFGMSSDIRIRTGSIGRLNGNVSYIWTNE